MYYEKDHVLGFAHVDNRAIHRPSALFEIMQDAATEHADQLHLSREELGALWVLSRLRVTMSRPLRVHERVHVRTWCAGFKGPNWLRVFELSVEGALLGEAMSSWITLDHVDHRILRPHALPLQFDAADMCHPTALAMPGKLNCGGLAPHHVHTVRYSDLDVNGHMNNVKIVDVICDGLDLDRRDGWFVDTLQVNYTAECMPGEEIALSAGALDDQTVGVCGMAAGKIKFEAAAHFAPYGRG